jgi:hypothetical protein
MEKKKFSFHFIFLFFLLPNIFTVFQDDFCVHRRDVGKYGKLGACVEGAELVGVDPSIRTAASSSLTALTGPRL